MINREKLQSDRERVKRELGQIAARREVLGKAAEAIAWQEELAETLDRGGAGRSAFPYDIEGAWRLVEIDGGEVAYLPVVALSELPDGVKPLRRVVEDEELASGQCHHCEETIPLIGRGSIGSGGFGDTTDKYEVAVVHCNTVQLQAIEDKLPFMAHIFPSSNTPDHF